MYRAGGVMNEAAEPPPPPAAPLTVGGESENTTCKREQSNFCYYDIMQIIRVAASIFFIYLPYGECGSSLARKSIPADCDWRFQPIDGGIVPIEVVGSR
jgi:hypothetical protein